MKLFVDSIVINILEFLLDPVHLSIPIGLIGLIVGAFVLWLSAQPLEFRNRSFWTSLHCMAVANSVSVVGVLVMPRIPFLATIGAGLGFLAVAGMISAAWLFREPVWKTVAAIGLVLLSEVLVVVVCFWVIAARFSEGIGGIL